MKLMKVFDCTDMPETVRRAFFDYYTDDPVGNDCYVDWYPLEEYDLHKESVEKEEEFVYDLETSRRACIVNEWLLEDGAEKGESVIIKHWW